MNEYTTEVRSSSEISEAEIAEFSEIIDAYGAVNGTLEQIICRVRCAKTICFVRHRKRMVATAALKSPTSSYRDKLKRDARVELSKFPFEMGYVVVVEGHRGEILADKGRLSDLVMSTVMSQVKACNVFATTKIPYFKETALPKLGFLVEGEYTNCEKQTIHVLTKTVQSEVSDMRLLVKRFGTLPQPVVAQIAAGSIKDLDRWVDRVLEAPTLEAVFGERRDH